MKPEIVVWKHLNSDHLDLIYGASNNENLLGVISDIFKLDDNPKNQVLLEFYFHTLQFAKTHKMNYAQTSTLFSILKLLQEMCASTPYNNNKETQEFFKVILVKHALQRPPYSIGVFDVSQVQHITEFVLNTFFRHFSMYKYVFTPKVRVDLTFEYDGLPPTPEPSPPPPSEPAPEDDAAEDVGDEDMEHAPVEMSEEEKHLRDVIQRAIGTELKQLQSKLEKMIVEHDEKITKQVEALEETAGVKPAKKSAKKKK